MRLRTPDSRGDGAGQRTRRVHIDSLRCLSPLGMNERNRDFDSGMGNVSGINRSRFRSAINKKRKEKKSGTLKFRAI